MYLLAKFDKQGNLTFSSKGNERKYNKFKSFYMDTGAYFSLSVNDINKTSTEAQHKLFFRICGMVAEESGHEFIEIRDFMYESCLPVMETGDNDIFGDAIIERRGLSMLDIKEFNIFLEKVIVIANSNFDMGLELHASEEFGTIIKTKE